MRIYIPLRVISIVTLFFISHVAQSSGLSPRAAPLHDQPAWSLEDLLSGHWDKALFRGSSEVVFMLIVLRNLLNEAKIVFFQRLFIFKVRFERKNLHYNISGRGIEGGGEPSGSFSCSRETFTATCHSSDGPYHQPRTPWSEVRFTCSCPAC